MADAPWSGDACSLVDAFRTGERSPDPELTASMLSWTADESVRLMLTQPDVYPLDRILDHARWVLDQIERTHAKVLEKWDGDMDSVAGARDMIREYLLRTNGRAAFRMFQIAPQH